MLRYISAAIIILTMRDSGPILICVEITSAFSALPSHLSMTYVITADAPLVNPEPLGVGRRHDPICKLISAPEILGSYLAVGLAALLDLHV